MTREEALVQLDALRAEVDRDVGALELEHAGRLRCGRGCSACCVDDLSVFEIEADAIRARFGALLERGAAGTRGACAFLDSDGACRIYEQRPYVCRTQGLPLRWIDEDAGVERRDICPLNEDGEPLEALPEQSCWTLGPAEGRLAALQAELDGGALRRVALRALFRI